MFYFRPYFHVRNCVFPEHSAFFQALHTLATEINSNKMDISKKKI